ncbi:TonB-dependent receptor [Paraglaciecola hydrolytica]|uniref:Ligand-gated channel protein n=1 Tax=Paraglaciecola hydrolytica TaxID=1799789 RepID=A0A136A553_9ALTE|nr:TonB-dependent receptor [Paraglaciecola hydrolytica]KXI30378.1 ligand-gated channel protein [Paraglaciecola hydrolytica]
MKNTGITTLALAISAQLVSQNYVQAAESANKLTDKNIENIIVTGSRVFESIDEVPASITVISRAQIEQHLKVSPELQSLLAIYVPGMAPNTGTSSNAGQTLRGRSPLIMIDGVPQSTPLRNGSLDIKTLDPSAIARIEIIKGATSIYGNGAAGGIINYITKKPSSEKLSGEVNVSSRFSMVDTDESVGGRIEAAINGTLDKFSYLLTASYEQSGVQRDAQGDIPGLQYGLSDTETQNYFTKLSYQFDPQKSVQLSYNFYSAAQKTDLADVAGDINLGEKTYAIHVPKEQQLLGNPPGQDGNTNLMLKYTDEALFANTQMTVDFYQQDIENTFFYSPSFANPDEGYTGGQSIIKSEKMGARATFNTQVDFDMVEASFIYGVDALNDITSQPLADGRIWVPEMDMQNLAFFLQTKWLIADDLIFKLGIRQDDIELQVDDYQTLKQCRSATQCQASIDVTGGTIDYKATTYNAGIKYNWSPLFSPFVSYSQGADISDIGRLLRTATVTDIALIRTEASIIDSYELGFNSQVSNDLRFEFAAYRSTSELGTSSSFDANTGVYLPVRAPQKIWGYEGLVDYRINPQLQVVATYSYVEGKDTEADEYLGAQQIAPPKATVNFSWLPISDVSVSLTYLYVADRQRFAAADNGTYVGDQGPVESYQLVNLSGQYKLNQQWSAFFGIENLLNEDYFPAKSQSYRYGGYNVKGIGTTANVGLKVIF